ncbi:transcriptional regulator [Streptomyces sp. NBRC 110611]|nr:transcriptional regulator [Streptomyces sp. NBRC 110611]
MVFEVTDYRMPPIEFRTAPTTRDRFPPERTEYLRALHLNVRQKLSTGNLGVLGDKFRVVDKDCRASDGKGRHMRECTHLHVIHA